MYEILISREAEKYYTKLDIYGKRKINKGIDILRKNPLLGSHIKKLHGPLQGKYRYETGGLRVIYEVDRKNNIVAVKAIGRRGDVYK